MGVPVKDISRIYGVDSNGKLWGKLWSFPYSATGNRSSYNWSETNGIMKISNKTSYREPDVIHNNTKYDIDSSLQSYFDGKTQYDLLSRELEESFYETIKSIKEYGGFYIGRYETGGLNGEAVVRKMDTNIGSQTWYSMYEKTKKLSGENENIKTMMLWGSLFDEVLQWFVDSKAITSNGIQITYEQLRGDSIDWGNYYNSEFKYIPKDSEEPKMTEEKGKNTTVLIPTGSSEYTRVNNIYDLTGNVYDWTLEAYSTSLRVVRGGCYGNWSYGYTAAYRYYYEYNPETVNGNCRRSCNTFNKITYRKTIK